MKVPPEVLSKLHEEIGVGREVGALVNNDTIKKVLDGLLHGLQNSWLGETDRDNREVLWQQGQGVLKFVEAMRSLINTGNLAQAQLDQLKKEHGDGKADE